MVESKHEVANPRTEQGCRQRIKTHVLNVKAPCFSAKAVFVRRVVQKITRLTFVSTKNAAISCYANLSAGIEIKSSIQKHEIVNCAEINVHEISLD